MKRKPPRAPGSRNWPTSGAQITDDWHPDARRRILGHEAIVGLQNGSLDGLLAYLRDEDTEGQPLPNDLRDWLAALIDWGPPDVNWRLEIRKHPDLKHAALTVMEQEEEFLKGDRAIVAFLNADGLESYKRGIGAACDTTGWGRTKATEFLSRWRIERMRVAVLYPELDLDPVAAGHGLKVFRQSVPKSVREAAWERLRDKLPDELVRQMPLTVLPLLHQPRQNESDELQSSTD